MSSPSSFKFLGYRISNIECHVGDTFPAGPEEISHDIKVQNNHHKDNKRFVEVVLKISVKNARNDFSFKLEIKGGFQGTDDISDELFSSFSKKNGPAILFPFARAIITSYTAQANIPPVILPTINFSN